MASEHNDEMGWFLISHLITIQFSLFSYFDDDDYNGGNGGGGGGGGKDGHLQVMIGGALASPPAPDPPSSFKLEISWKNFV